MDVLPFNHALARIQNLGKPAAPSIGDIPISRKLGRLLLRTSLGNGDGLQRGESVPIMTARVDLECDIRDIGEID
jgi:hypothetical protein